MFLVVIFILSIVLAFSQPLFRWVTATESMIPVAALATLGPALVAWLTARHCLKRLEARPDDPGPGQRALARGATLVHVLLATGHGFLLLGTDWMPLTARTPVVGRWPVVPALLAVVPFLLAVLLVWIGLYPAERAVRQIALEVFLFRGRPVRPVWTLGQYLVNNLRHQVLFVLVPLLLIVAARDVITLYENRLRSWSGHPYFPDVLLGLSALVVALVAPEILRHVWSTRRLPDGPLRDRLQAICRRLRLRHREILVWRVGGLIVNAAVMGVVAPLRYLLLTDGLLEQLDDTQVEAVFGHEAGHVKRHHIFYFLLFALISGCIVTIFSVHTHGLPPHASEFQAAAVFVGALLLFKWGVLFGWISRRFERQADMFGTRVLAQGGLPCQGPCCLHNPENNPGPPPADALCSTAATLFGNTLNEVAVLNGISPNARSWRHGSISQRSRTLQELARNPRAARRAERTVRLIKLGIFLSAVIGCLWAGYELHLWKLLAFTTGG